MVMRKFFVSGAVYAPLWDGIRLRPGGDLPGFPFYAFCYILLLFGELYRGEVSGKRESPSML
jgi:hypothetical protein